MASYWRYVPDIRFHRQTIEVRTFSDRTAVGTVTITEPTPWESIEKVRISTQNAIPLVELRHDEFDVLAAVTDAVQLHQAPGQWAITMELRRIVNGLVVEIFRRPSDGNPTVANGTVIVRHQ